MAPPTYVGNCSSLMDNVEGLSRTAKMKLEAVCGVMYPCQEELVPLLGANQPLTSPGAARQQLSSLSLRNGPVPAMVA